MLRHEFQPGRLVGGVFIALTGVIYAGDAGGLWETPWFAVIPLITGGLCVAAVAGSLARGIRRHRRRERPAQEGTRTPQGGTRAPQEGTHIPG